MVTLETVRAEHSYAEAYLFVAAERKKNDKGTPMILRRPIQCIESSEGQLDPYIGHKDLIMALIDVGLFDKAMNLCSATFIEFDIAIRYIAICIANNSISELLLDVRESVEPWPHNEELAWRFLRRYAAFNPKLVAPMCEGLCIGEYPAELPQWLFAATDDWCTVEIIGRTLLRSNRIEEAKRLLIDKLRADVSSCFPSIGV